MWGVNFGQDFAVRVMRQGSRLRITLLSLSLITFRTTPLFLGVAKNKDVVTVLTSAEKRWNFN
jgi:hypothetical protein